MWGLKSRTANIYWSLSPCNKCNTWLFWKSFAGNMWKCVWETRARSASTSRSSCLVWCKNDSGDKHCEDECWKPLGGAVDDISIGNKCRHWGTYKMVSSAHILSWGRGMSVDFITEDCLLAHYALRGNHPSLRITLPFPELSRSRSFWAFAINNSPARTKWIEVLILMSWGFSKHRLFSINTPEPSSVSLSSG